MDVKQKIKEYIDDGWEIKELAVKFHEEDLRPLQVLLHKDSCSCNKLFRFQGNQFDIDDIVDYNENKQGGWK